jgi:hypothetical protein
VLAPCLRSRLKGGRAYHRATDPSINRPIKSTDPTRFLLFLFYRKHQQVKKRDGTFSSIEKKRGFVDYHRK